MRNTKGITLVALVITIIILLILAGVSISVIKNNNIIYKAEETRKVYKVSEIKEKINIELNNEIIDNYNKITQNKLTEILSKYGEIQYDEENGDILGINIENGGFIPIGEIFSGKIIASKLETLQEMIDKIKENENSNFDSINLQNVEKYDPILKKNIDNILKMNENKIILYRKDNETKIYEVNKDFVVSESNYKMTDIIKEEKFEYTGSYQKYECNASGTYNIKLWGASGGDAGIYTGGNGAYTTGNINLNVGDILYVYIGEKGKDSVSTTSQGRTFNGGGNWSSNITTDRQGGRFHRHKIIKWKLGFGRRIEK